VRARKPRLGEQPGTAAAPQPQQPGETGGKHRREGLGTDLAVEGRGGPVRDRRRTSEVDAESDDDPVGVALEKDAS
jgi:hypothetical protein